MWRCIDMIMNNINKIKNIKNEIKLALQDKNISVNDVDLYRYEERIRQLPVGGEPQNTWYIVDAAGKVTNIILVLPTGISFFNIYTGSTYPIYELYYNSDFEPKDNIDYSKS